MSTSPYTMALRHHAAPILLGLLTLASMSGCSIGGMLAALTPGGDVTVERDIAFGDHPRQRLDTYVPADVTEKKPLIVFFYGGSWNGGSRDLYRFVGKKLASLGYVTVIPDYRVYPEVLYPAFVRDGAGAVAWAANYAQRLGADPQRIILMGHSAGAYNAAMLAFAPEWLDTVGVAHDRIAAFIGMAGPYDFYPIINPDVKPVFNHPDYPPDSQPIDQVDAHAPRTLLQAARADELVDPQRNTEQLARLLREASVSVDVHLYDRVGHMTLIGALSGPLGWLAPVEEDLAAFLASVTASSAVAVVERTRDRPQR